MTGRSPHPPDGTRPGRRRARPQPDPGERPLGSTDLKRLHRTWRRRTELDLGLILDGVQKPFNVGAVYRSAAAYRAATVWLVPPSPGPDDPGVSRTALGCERLVSTVRAGSGPEAVADARSRGLVTVAIELTATARPLFEIKLGPAVCLVLGHEDRGVHRSTLAEVDHVAYLPQLGKVGSLNVAQAATVAIYETARQRWSGPDR
ncbi:MAG: TrmH family RNA methyltransferase [Acidimicrobiales bacterium]